MMVSKEDIELIIPQRKPFVMIDHLITADTTGFESDFKITDQNIFLENDVLQEPALIENIAQTCAAGFGYLESISGSEPRLGFIGAISKLEVHRLPRVQTTINTIVKVTYQMENIFLVIGENFCEGEKLLACEMKIVIN